MCCYSMVLVRITYVAILMTPHKILRTGAQQASPTPNQVPNDSTASSKSSSDELSKHEIKELKVRIYFPDFLIPCVPVFIGPFPLAFSARSFLAWASSDQSINTIVKSSAWTIFIQKLVLFLSPPFSFCGIPLLFWFPTLTFQSAHRYPPLFFQLSPDSS